MHQWNFQPTFVGMERATEQLQPLGTPATLHFFLTQDSTSSSLGPAADQLRLNTGKPPSGLENKKSACPGSTEIPRATHLVQHQNTCTLPASAWDSNPSGMGRQRSVQGRTATLLDPPGPTKPWQHFPYNSPRHLAEKSASWLKNFVYQKVDSWSSRTRRGTGLPC